MLTPGGGGYGPTGKAERRNMDSNDSPPAKRKNINVFTERGSVNKYKLEQESV